MFTITSAPYGETITREFDAEVEALVFVESLEAMAGESYLTSWGYEAVNVDYVISGSPSHVSRVTPASRLSAGRTDRYTAKHAA